MSSSYTNFVCKLPQDLSNVNCTSNLPFTVKLFTKFHPKTSQNDTPTRTTGDRLTSRTTSRLIFCDWEFQILNKVSIFEENASGTGFDFSSEFQQSFQIFAKRIKQIFALKRFSFTPVLRSDDDSEHQVEDFHSNFPAISLRLPVVIHHSTNSWMDAYNSETCNRITVNGG